MRFPHHKDSRCRRDFVKLSPNRPLSYCSLQQLGPVVRAKTCTMSIQALYI